MSVLLFLITAYWEAIEMTHRFWIIFAFYLCAIMATSFVGISLVVEETYQLTFEQSAHVVSRAFLESGWYKKVASMALFVALAYLGTRYTIVGKL